MKVQFTLKGVTGAQLTSAFENGIKTERIGWDPDFTGSTGGAATLTEEGGYPCWVTAWSGFKYQILNWNDDTPAVVLYQGPHRGFLAQNLLPQELNGETTEAVIIDGSALKRHPGVEMRHANACTLVEAYAIMAKANPDAGVIEQSFSAVDGRKKVQEILKEVSDAGKSGATSFVHVGTLDGYPAIWVTCCPGGEQIKKGFKVADMHGMGPSGPRDVVARIEHWLRALQPVIHVEWNG